VAPHIVSICEAAATPLMGSVRVSRSLQENAAITLGRAAMVCPDQVGGWVGVLCWCVLAGWLVGWVASAGWWW
jgi:hypothetical protein